MAKAIHSDPVSEPKTSAGLAWIAKALETIAAELPIHIETWDWHIDSATGTGDQYVLTVVGNRRKRAAKLFSKREVEKCLEDKILQEEIRLRLTKILTFLGPNH